MKRIIFAAIAALAVVIIFMVPQNNKETKETEAPVVAEKICLPKREIVTDEKGNLRVLVWTKVETYYTSERMPNGDYAEYETRVEYIPKIQGDSVYYTITSREERLMDCCNTKRYPSGPVVVKSPMPVALSDIEVEV